MLRGDPQSYYAFLGDDVLEAQDQGFARREQAAVVEPRLLGRRAHVPGSGGGPGAQARARRALRQGRRGRGLRLRLRRAGLAVGARVRASAASSASTSRRCTSTSRRSACRRTGSAIAWICGSASATELPLEAGSVDKVVALESAFHFDTREQFFAEAQRVLKPGGRIATADCVPFPGEAPSGAGQSPGLAALGRAAREHLRSRGLPARSSSSRLQGRRGRVDPQLRVPRDASLLRSAPARASRWTARASS